MDNQDVEQLRSVLDNARTVLKEKFVDIDQQIDQFIDLIEPAYLMPQLLRDRPLVINLWGMTGNGKTDLVEQALSLLKLDARCWRIDMGELSPYFGEINLTEAAQHLSDTSSDNQIKVMVFDELDKARTLDNAGNEKDNGASRIYWSLIDSGIARSRATINIECNRIKRILKQLQFLQNSNIVVENNVLVSNTELLQDYFNSSELSYVFNTLKSNDCVEPIAVPQKEIEIDSVIRFINHDALSTYTRCAKDYCLETIPDVVHLVRPYDSWEYYSVAEKIQINESLDRSPYFADFHACVSWLQGLVQNFTAQMIINLNPCILINIGNLDEAFLTSDNSDNDPDIDADHLRVQTQQITIVDIKTQLLKRFRAEQVGRFGHNHIIYPTIGREGYTKLIVREVESAMRLTKDFGMELSFDESILDMLYQETVFPNQGARCVKTGVQGTFVSYLPRILWHMKQEKIESGDLTFDITRDSYIFKNISQEEKVFPVHLSVIPLRRYDKNDRYYVIAVHEAAHVLAFYMLRGVIPFSTKIHGAVGIDCRTELEVDDSVKTVDVLHSNIICCYAGTAAEHVVFGHEFSIGCALDRIHATSMLLHSLNWNGLLLPAASTRIELQANDMLYSEHIRTLIDTECNRQLSDLYNQAQLWASAQIGSIVKLAAILLKQGYMPQNELQSFFDNNDISKGTAISHKQVFTDFCNQKEIDISADILSC